MLANYFDINMSDLIEPYDINKSLEVPIYGKIPAGIPLEAIEDIVGYTEVTPSMLNGDKEYFGLIVAGDSMSPNLTNDDVVILQKQNDCENGEICAVLVNGNEATLKRVYKDFSKELITLKPDNPNYEMKIYGKEDDSIRIIGVARQMIRKL